MRIALAVPERHVSAPILNAALEGVTRLDEKLVRSGAVPTFARARKERGIRWKPEPPGGEHFDHAALVLDRGWGDCDDLAPWHAASLRATGKDPKAHAIVRKSGPRRWHCVVKRSDGSIEDPSLAAGMPKPGAQHGTKPAVMPVMAERAHGVGGTYIATPHLAIRPIPGVRNEPEAWQARTDLPWHWNPGDSAADVAMVSLHKSPVSDQALVGACRGAIALGEASRFAHPDHLDRLEAIVDACNGATWEELADEYGPEHATAAGQVVGSFFGNIARKVSRAVKHPTKSINWAIKHSPAALSMKAAKHIMSQARPVAQEAMPMAQMAAPFLGPMGMAFQMASPMLQQLLQSGQHLPPAARTSMSYPPQPWPGMPTMPGY